MKRYIECIKNKVDCVLNVGCSVIALVGGTMAAFAYAGSVIPLGFWSIMKVAGTFALITSFPSVISVLIGTVQYFGEKMSEKNDPAYLLKEAQIRLETEKVLIEAERLAQERRQLIDRHLQEQIHGADNIATMLDQSRNGKEVGRQRVALS